MRSLPRLLVRTSLLVCGLALGGCAIMNTSGRKQPIEANGAATMPAANNSVTANAVRTNGTGNSYIGNGAFGEAPP